MAHPLGGGYWLEKVMTMTPKEELFAREQLTDVIRRLRNIEGHVRGVARMIEAGEPCPYVLRQVLAVQGALNKVRQILVRDYLEGCLAGIPEDDMLNELNNAISELSEILIGQGLISNQGHQ